MDQITRRAYGKVNLTLDVTGRRADGYHDIRTVMQTVDVCDTLTFTKNDSGHIQLSTSHTALPVNEDNLIVRACELMRTKYKISQGVQVDLTKEIPVAAGMAGGSTDAACALHAMNDLFDLHLSADELDALGLAIGADVPFCLHGGTYLAEGIGERLTALPSPPPCTLLIVGLQAHVSTKEIYQRLDAAPVAEHPDVDGLIDAIRNQDLYRMCNLMGNVLEPVTRQRVPQIADLENTLLDYGAARAMMSGSGPTVFALFDTSSDAVKAYHVLKARGSFPALFVSGWAV